MGPFQSCAKTPSRKGECVQVLEGIRSACNTQADNAQARMQELGSVDSKEAKPEMASYHAALNNLFGISREAQQLSYNDPAALALLKNVNMDTGRQQNSMNRTFEIVAKKQKDAEAARKKKKPSEDPAKRKTPGAKKPRPKSGSPNKPRGEPGGGGPAGDPGRTQEDEESEEDEGEETAESPAPDDVGKSRTQNSDKALTRADSLGNMLKNSRVDESAGDIPGGASGGGAATGGSTGGGPGGGAASPKNPSDLLLASVSGFKGSFNALGLEMGRGPDGQPRVLGRSGAPASPAEVTALQERISSDPMALMRRPDFFDVFPRENFTQLKGDFKTRPALRESEFKHVALSDSDRDFLHSESCSKLSGDCNRNAVKGSYKKGEYVSPENLRAIHGKIHRGAEDEDSEEERGEPDSGEESTLAEDDSAKAPKPAPSSVKTLYGKLNAVIMGVLGMFQSEPAPAGPIKLGAGDKGAADRSVGKGSGGSAGVLTGKAARRSGAPPGVSDKRPGASPPPPPRRPSRAPVYGALALAAAAAVFFWSRRSRQNGL